MAAQSTMPEDAWWLGTDSGAVAEDSGSDTTSINAHKVPDGNIGIVLCVSIGLTKHNKSTRFLARSNIDHVGTVNPAHLQFIK